ncbi:hypothetical protein ACFOGJ_00880 [Marinibaculum pumilum]|uniref:STAS domain-containing protein n=1 Tax=Marinibaculum pumilum TaxID=1766165 RepID=A0ABV7KUI7_9PROT
MPITFGKSTARFEGACVAEEVLPLLDWLQTCGRARINLARCTHLHTAVLQALRAARVEVRQAPADPFLNRHVLPFLREARGTADDRNKE